MAAAAPSLQQLFDDIPALTNLWNDVAGAERDLVSTAKDDRDNNRNNLDNYFIDLHIPQNLRYRVRGRLLAIVDHNAQGTQTANKI